MVLFAAAVLWTPAAMAGSNPHFKKGKKLLHDMEDAKAIKAFNQALEEPGLPVQEKASIYVYIGIAQFNQMKQAKAKAAFKKALETFPDVKLPGQTSPKIKGVFKEVKAAIKPKVAPKPKPKPKPKPRPIKIPTEPKNDRAALRWSAWGTLGVAVAAAGTGVAMAVLAKDAEEQAKDTRLTFPEAEKLHEKGQNRALLANIMFGVAGAAAVTSGVLFYFGYRKRPESAPRVTAAVVPLPTGLMIQVGGIRW